MEEYQVGFEVPGPAEPTLDSVYVEKDKVPFEGEEVVIAKRVWVVPQLSLKQAKTIQPRVNSMQQGTLPTFQVIAEVVFAALKRNYPNLTMDLVEDQLLTVGNSISIFQQVMRVAGFKQGEGAGQPTMAPSTGTTSTPT